MERETWRTCSPDGVSDNPIGAMMQPRRARLERSSSGMSRNGRAGGYGVSELRVRACKGSNSNV